MVHWRFSLRLTLLGALAGALLVGAAFLTIAGKPLTACLVGLSATLVLLALRRTASQADSALALALSQIGAGLDDRPPPLDTAFPQLSQAIGDAMDRLANERRLSRQRATEVSALLDTVPAALFALDGERTVLATNKAARQLSGGKPKSLDRVAALKAGDVRFLARAPAGTRTLIHLADGRSALVTVAVFTPTGAGERRLISLQLVAEELYAVELNAWQSMARVLSHEMMNSLAPVVSLAETLELLCAGGTAPDRKEITRIAGLVARRAGHIMNFVDRYREMLDIPEPVVTAVPVKDFLADLAGLAQALPGSHRIAVQVDPPKLVAHFDRELLEQALLNLLKNAAEATTEEQHPQICIFALLEGDTVCIEVQDNGVGLPSRSEDVFLPFYSRKAGGSGIGLAVARRIAQTHAGTLVAKRKDRGTAFVLRLPSLQQ